MNVITLAQAPLKSGKLQFVPSLSLRLMDQVDRRLCLVGKDGEVLTARKYPKIQRIGTVIDPDGLITFFLPKEEHVQIRPDQLSIANVDISLWGLKGKGSYLNERNTIDQVISNFIGYEGARIVENSLPFNRQVSEEYIPAHKKVMTSLSWKDGGVFTLITTGTLEKVSEYAQEKGLPPITNRSLRMNIVVEGEDEYRWKHIRIGEQEFVFQKPCDRCVMVDVDANTGEKFPPKDGYLSVLLKHAKGKDLFADITSPEYDVYRIGEKSKRVYAGINIMPTLPLVQNEISVGAEVEVLESF